MTKPRRLTKVVALSVGAVLATASLVSIPAFYGDVQPAQAAPGDLFIDDPLSNQATLANKWIVSGSKKIQANGADWKPRINKIADTIPQTGGGTNNSTSFGVNSDKDNPWLTLTTDFTPTSNSMSSGQPTGDGQAGFVLNRDEFDSNLGVVMEYDQRIWRSWPGLIAGHVSTDTQQQYTAGSGLPAAQAGYGGGDGISVMLVDAAAYPDRDDKDEDGSVKSGAYGAGLGYSSAAGRSSDGKTLLASVDQEQGVAGGYLGVGFDIHGNYANYTSFPGLASDGGTTRPPVFTGNPWENRLITGVATANDQTANGIVRTSNRAPNTIGVRGSGVQHAALWPDADWGVTAWPTGAGVTPTQNTVQNPGNFNRNYGMTAGNASDALTKGGYLWHGGSPQSLPMAGTVPPAAANDYQSGTTIFFKPDTSRWSGATNISYGIDGIWTTNQQMTLVTIAGEDWYWYTVNENYKPVEFVFLNGADSNDVIGGIAIGGNFKVQDGGAWTVNPALNGQNSLNFPTTGPGGRNPQQEELRRVYPGPGNTNNFAFQNNYHLANMYNRVKVSITPEDGGNHRVQVSMSQPLNVNNDECTGSEATNDLRCAYNGPIQYTEILNYVMGSGNTQYQAALPEQFMLGFGASTGWAINYHQIRNVVTTPIIDPMITKKIANGTFPASGYVDHTSAQVGSQVSYQLDLQNNGPAAISQETPTRVVDGLNPLPVASNSWRIQAVAGKGGSFRYQQDGVWSDWYVASDGVISGQGSLPPIEWAAPANAVSNDPAVKVWIAATVLPDAGTLTWVNTAEVIPDPEGPRDSNLLNNQDTASFTSIPAPVWRVTKSSDPASGSLVAGGDTITYSVTATADRNTGTPAVTTIYYQAPPAWVFQPGQSVNIQTQSRPLGSSGPWSSDWNRRVMTAVPGSETIPGGLTNNGRWWKISYASDEELRAYFNADSNPWDSGLWNNQENGYIFDEGIKNYTLIGVNRGVQPNNPVSHDAPAGSVINNSITNATLHDDLSEVLQYADLIDSAADLKVQLTGVTGDLPICAAGSDPCYSYDSGTKKLEVRNVGIVASASSEVSRTATYSVRVKQDVDADVNFKNVATGSSTQVPPSTCPNDGSVVPGDPAYAECWTEHLTAAEFDVQILKVGENIEGNVAPMNGSEWGIYPSDNGEPDLDNPAAELGAETVDPGPPSQTVTGLFSAKLAPGTYWLIETKALPGFNLLPNGQEFTVANDGSVTLASPGNSIYISACPSTGSIPALCELIPDDESGYSVDYSENPTIVVKDIPILDLPESGGTVDAAWYYLAGGLALLLAVAAGGVYLIRRRQSSEA